MNYDPFSREQIFLSFFEFSVYGLRLQVLITATADEPVYREYRSLYSRYTGRLFTCTVSHALKSRVQALELVFYGRKIEGGDQCPYSQLVKQNILFYRLQIERIDTGD
jgi:hypothetical protein